MGNYWKVAKLDIYTQDSQMMTNEMEIRISWVISWSASGFNICINQPGIQEVHIEGGCRATQCSHHGFVSEFLKNSIFFIIKEKARVKVKAWMEKSTRKDTL